MNPQLEGVEDLPGTYVFDIRASSRALRLNRFLWGLTRPENRERFRDDEGAAGVHAGLSEVELALVRDRDWLGLIKYGVSFFLLEKLARTVGTSNLEMYAQMRSETFEEFMRTRNVPGAR